MKQDIYDDPAFFAGYKALRDNESGLNAAIEEPAIKSLLPSLVGACVLDLGCGFGEFCRCAIEGGARRVTGIDISEKMVVEAQNRTKSGAIFYARSAIEDYPMLGAEYDLIVCRLALHYVKDYKQVISKVFDGLKAGGAFIFSVEHPICTALCAGWHINGDGKEDFWPVDNYKVEGMRKQRWFVDGVIKYHRTIETYINTLLEAGLCVARVLEPRVHETFSEMRMDLRSSLRRPPLLIVKAEKQPNHTQMQTPTTVMTPASHESRQP